MKQIPWRCALEMRIADADYAAEDVIESHIVDPILPDQSENQRNRLGFFNCFRTPKADGGEMKIDSLDLYQGLQKVIEDMGSIKKEAMAIGADLQLHGQLSAAASLTKLERKTTMVGCDDASLELMDKLTGGRPHRQVIPIVGMGGIGKTTLARTVYSKPLITEHFNVCVWSTISQAYNTTETLREVVCQAMGLGEVSEKSEDKLGTELYKHLFGRRFLIVLDDMWSIDAWDMIQRFFPDNENGSRVLVTTRLSTLTSQLDNSNYCLKMDFLDEGSSWELFSKSVFGKGSCPLELEEIGKQIVENCRGLPLSIIVVGGLLVKLERTKKCWESIKKKLNPALDSENDEHCLKILKTSYNHLPVYLKPCFLHLGVFEEDRAIRVSTVIKLWVSEGFLKPASDRSLETVAREYLEELIDRNLIQVHILGSTGKLQYCKLHDSLRDLCLRESEKERFYHVVGQQQQQHSPRRRIVVLKGTLKTEVVEAMESTPHARSYVSDGDMIQSLPNLRLLRTLKAFDSDTYRCKCSLRDVFELVNLRYIETKGQGHSQLPCSINLLWSLQTLIVSRCNKEVNAPVEIWKMPQLRHVHFYGRGLHLPDPSSDSIVVMENLLTLKGVKSFRCDEEVVRRIRNIKKLGLEYNISDKRDDQYFCLHNIGSLQKLESFSCKGVTRKYLLKKLTLPPSLKSLHLANVWLEELLEKMSSLPLLQKLRLERSWFRRGCQWETIEGQFPSLKLFSLNRCRDFECWMMESSHFPCLGSLYLHKVSPLKEIPSEIGDIPTL
ncbi:hypothetical protein OROHE_017968 [Orobanche hederae]